MAHAAAALRYPKNAKHLLSIAACRSSMNLLASVCIPVTFLCVENSSRPLFKIEGRASGAITACATSFSAAASAIAVQEKSAVTWAV